MSGKIKLKILGTQDKFNEILIKVVPNPTKNLIYFPGDVQDEEDRMEKSEYSQFLEYSLDRTLEILSGHYENCVNVFIIRPSRFIASISEFDALLRPGQGILHLITLFQGALHEIEKSKESFQFEILFNN